MPPSATADVAGPDFDRHFRRAVWITALIAVIAAGMIYADKAGDDRSAFIRWRPQVLQFWRGVNIYDKMMFPNPPIMPITLYPLMTLPPLEGALTWYALKVVMTAFSVWFCFKMVRPDDLVLPSWVQGSILLLSFRPILGDLHHGNNNLLILFLIVSCLLAWRKGYDVLAGLVLGLAIAYKVTPALFVPYFLYKRSYRTVAATFAGLVLFLLVVPSLVIGPGFNGVCLATWWQRMLSPFLEKGYISQQEINQSMVGVLTRLLSDAPTGEGRYDVHLDVNLISMAAPAGGPAGQGAFGRSGRPAGVALPDEGRPGPAERPPAVRRVRPGRLDDALRLGAELEAPLRDALAPLHLSDVPRGRGARGGAGAARPGVGDGALDAADGDDVERAGGPLRAPPGAQDRAGVRYVPLGGGRPLRRHGLAGAGGVGRGARPIAVPEVAGPRADRPYRKKRGPALRRLRGSGRKTTIRK